MSGKKPLNSVAIGVGVLCAVLLIALAYSVMNYTSMLQDKDRTIASLSGQNTNVPNTSDKDAIIRQKDAELSQKNAEIDRLNGIIRQKDADINSLKAPKLISVNLKSDDTRPWLSTPYVHVYGYVINVGTNTANNAKVHVVLYQSGNVIAKDTYITLGSVSGESYTSADANVFYEGSAITSKTLTLEWT